MEKELKHVGILGMHWGRRKAEGGSAGSKPGSGAKKTVPWSKQKGPGDFKTNGEMVREAKKVGGMLKRDVQESYAKNIGSKIASVKAKIPKSPLMSMPFYEGQKKFSGEKRSKTEAIVRNLVATTALAIVTIKVLEKYYP